MRRPAGPSEPCRFRRASFVVTTEQQEGDTMRFMSMVKSEGDTEHWKGWEGETEIRRVMEAPDFGHKA